MSAPLPREHGAWAMLITPPVVALVTAGPDLLGVLAILGWFFAYCARGPIEVLRGAGASGKAGMARSSPETARLWLLIFAGLGVTLLGPVVIFYPVTLALLLSAAVLLLVVQWLADHGHTRSVAAGLLAAAGLMLGGPLYYLAATGQVGVEGWTLALAAGAFFGGSIFRVKTLARERKSTGFRAISVALHLGALAAGCAAAATGLVTWWVPGALLLPAAWAVYGAMRAGEAVNLAVIGQGEQRLTILFGVLLMVALV